MLRWLSWAEALAQGSSAQRPSADSSVQLLRTHARSLGASAIALRYSMSPCSGSSGVIVGWRGVLTVNELAAFVLHFG